MSLRRPDPGRSDQDQAADERFGAAQRQLGQIVHRILYAFDRDLDLCRISAKLLAQSHGSRVHHVRASRLDHVIEFPGLGRQ